MNAIYIRTSCIRWMNRARVYIKLTFCISHTLSCTQCLMHSMSHALNVSCTQCLTHSMSHALNVSCTDNPYMHACTYIIWFTAHVSSYIKHVRSKPSTFCCTGNYGTNSPECRQKLLAQFSGVLGGRVSQGGKMVGRGLEGSETAGGH